MKLLMLCFASCVLAADSELRGAEKRDLIGFNTLNLMAQDLLQGIPAGTVQYGLAEVLDAANYESNVRKGKEPTTTTSTTMTTTTTVTTTRAIFPVLGFANQTCAETCALDVRTCYEGGQIRVNTDINFCLATASILGIYTAGQVFSFPEFLPTGCFMYEDASAQLILSISTNTFGTGRFGCTAEPSQTPPPRDVQRVCACFL